MKYKFDLSDKLKQIAENSQRLSKRLKKALQEDARDACEVMEQIAKAHTPHEGDGKERGFNVITNSLQDSWRAEFKASHSRKELGSVLLTNEKPYAPYVQNGHKVTKHFVPWLYKDSMGTISYETFHAQPMFGLVVGTKTNYVEGVDMVGPAQKAFDEAFEESSQKTIKRFADEIFKVK